jgi:hypothetical protein
MVITLDMVGKMLAFAGQPSYSPMAEARGFTKESLIEDGRSLCPVCLLVTDVAEDRY